MILRELAAIIDWLDQRFTVMHFEMQLYLRADGRPVNSQQAIF